MVYKLTKDEYEALLLRPGYKGVDQFPERGKPAEIKPEPYQGNLDLRETSRTPLYRILLPLPPPENNLYPTTDENGGRHKSARYKAWIKDALKRITIVGLPQTIAQPVFIQRHFQFKDAKHGDIEGYFKASADIFQKAGVIVNDRQIIGGCYSIEYIDGLEQSSVIIRLYPADIQVQIL